jgi:hypothetical protein
MLQKMLQKMLQYAARYAANMLQGTCNYLFECPPSPPSVAGTPVPKRELSKKKIEKI